MEKKPPALPKPSKIVRKLKLNKELVVPLTREEPGGYCTRKATGCPIHTC